MKYELNVYRTHGSKQKTTVSVLISILIHVLMFFLLSSPVQHKLPERPKKRGLRIVAIAARSSAFTSKSKSANKGKGVKGSKGKWKAKKAEGTKLPKMARRKLKSKGQKTTKKSKTDAKEAKKAESKKKIKNKTARKSTKIAKKKVDLKQDKSALSPLKKAGRKKYKKKLTTTASKATKKLRPHKKLRKKKTVSTKKAKKLAKKKITAKQKKSTLLAKKKTDKRKVHRKQRPKSPKKVAAKPAKKQKVTKKKKLDLPPTVPKKRRVKVKKKKMALKRKPELLSSKQRVTARKKLPKPKPISEKTVKKRVALAAKKRFKIAKAPKKKVIKSRKVRKQKASKPRQTSKTPKWKKIAKAKVEEVRSVKKRSASLVPLPKASPIKKRDFSDRPVLRKDKRRIMKKAEISEPPPSTPKHKMLYDSRRKPTFKFKKFKESSPKSLSRQKVMRARKKRSITMKLPTDERSLIRREENIVKLEPKRRKTQLQGSLEILKKISENTGAEVEADTILKEKSIGMPKPNLSESHTESKKISMFAPEPRFSFAPTRDSLKKKSVSGPSRRFRKRTADSADIESSETNVKKPSESFLTFASVSRKSLKNLSKTAISNIETKTIMENDVPKEFSYDKKLKQAPSEQLSDTELVREDEKNMDETFKVEPTKVALNFKTKTAASYRPSSRNTRKSRHVEVREEIEQRWDKTATDSEPLSSENLNYKKHSPSSITDFTKSSSAVRSQNLPISKAPSSQSTKKSFSVSVPYKSDPLDDSSEEIGYKSIEDVSHDKTAVAFYKESERAYQNTYTPSASSASRSSSIKEELTGAEWSRSAPTEEVNISDAGPNYKNYVPKSPQSPVKDSSVEGVSAPPDSQSVDKVQMESFQWEMKSAKTGTREVSELSQPKGTTASVQSLMGGQSSNFKSFNPLASFSGKDKKIVKVPMSVNRPSGGLANSKIFTLKGTVDDNSFGSTHVFINGVVQLATVGEDGSFSSTLPLKPGINEVQIYALSPKGKRSEQKFQLWLPPGKFTEKKIELLKPENGSLRGINDKLNVVGIIEDYDLSVATLYVNDIPRKISVRKGKFDVTIKAEGFHTCKLRVQAKTPSGELYTSNEVTVLLSSDPRQSNMNPQLN